MHTTHIKAATITLLTIALTAQTGCFTALSLIKQNQQKKEREASQAKFQEDLQKGEVAMLEGVVCVDNRHTRRRWRLPRLRRVCSVFNRFYIKILIVVKFF